MNLLQLFPSFHDHTHLVLDEDYVLEYLGVLVYVVIVEQALVLNLEVGIIKRLIFCLLLID